MSVYVCMIGSGFSQAWNTQTGTEMSLNGPTGQVYALAFGNGMLFAATQVNSLIVDAP